MARFVKKSKAEIGESPFELRFRGVKKQDKVRLRVMDYNAEDLQELELNQFIEIERFLDTRTVTWLNVDGLHDPELIKQIGEVFELDRIILSDVLNTEQRPKVQEYNEVLYISIKMVWIDEDTLETETENLSLVIAKNVLISFQEREGDVFEPVRNRIRMKKPKIRNSGTDYLAFALLDVVIDNYIYVISQIGEYIEEIEDRLLGSTDKELIEDINDLKREINFLKKNIKPAQEMVMALNKLESELISPDVRNVHFKELLDNVNHAIESLDSYREWLSDLLNIYHTTLSTRLNDIIRFLTIFSVIFIPLTFIAGIYGTNFDYLPELHYQYSYFIMWGVMIIIAVGMLLYFRKKEWL